MYWWAIDAMPLAGTNRKYGLLRQSVKTCIWLGPADCYRNQDTVLWTPSQATSAKHRADIALRTGQAGRTYRNSTISKSADERGGTTPFNLCPFQQGANRVEPSIILLPPPTMLPHGGADTFFRPMACCSTRSVAAVRCWRLVSTTVPVESDRHREREKVSGDCEAANCERLGCLAAYSSSADRLNRPPFSSWNSRTFRSVSQTTKIPLCASGVWSSEVAFLHD